MVFIHLVYVLFLLGTSLTWKMVMKLMRCCTKLEGGMHPLTELWATWIEYKIKADTDPLFGSFYEKIIVNEMKLMRALMVSNLRFLI